MDDMENKELEQKESEQPVPETIEETEASDAAAAADATEEKEETAEAVEEPAEDESEAAEVVEESEEEVPAADEPVEAAGEAVPKAPEKGGSNILAIVIGLAVFIAVLAFCWMAPVGDKVQDTGVFYAKDDDLYFYDLKNDPYLVQEDIGEGSSYHYFYTAWGVDVAEEGDWAYYIANINKAGEADLYRKNTKDASAKPEKIDSNVVDYMASKNGRVIAYLAQNGKNVELRLYDGKETRVVSNEMKLEENVYSLSGDGKYLVYTDAYQMLRTEVVEGGKPDVLTDDCPMYTLSEENGMLYYVAKVKGTYNIYSYDFKDEAQLVAENAKYMELMPNGRDLVYGVTPTEVIPYSEILLDDMAEADAAMKKGDANYEQKLMRDEIREAMKNGDGIQPLLQEYYLLTGGKATLIADDVISAISADSEKNFITGFKAKEFNPIRLSVITDGLDMVETIYYMSLNYGGTDAFLADASGNVEVLTGYGVQPQSVKVSSDGSRAAYLMTDPNTGGNILMQMKVGKAEDATAVEVNVEDFAFIGGNGPLCYYYNYKEGQGTLAAVGSNRTIENAAGVQFAEDVKDVYYISNLDAKTGVGQMEQWDGKGEPVVIDGGVFAFQYKGNDKVALIYNYDVKKQVGDLGYYDGTGVRKLDKNITGIFID